MMSETTLPINAIRVGARHRHDMGDLKLLADSIERVGLLHPIVVTADKQLVAGGRRLVACATLGWGEVPVRIVKSLDSASALLAAERDENTCRKDMSPSERVALGRALEELERPAAKARRLAAQNNNAVPESFRNCVRKGETRDLVGAAVGWSGHTYQRAKAVVVAAEAGDPVAVEALEHMDATGKVKGAFERTRGEPERTGHVSITTPRGLTIAEAHKRRVIELDAYLRGMCRALPDLNVNDVRAVCGPDELAHINRSLGDSIAALRKFRMELERGR